MLYNPIDLVDNDVALTIQHRWIATDCAKVLFEKMTHLASMKQKKSWRLFLTSCHVEAQYFMRNIFIPFLQLLPLAQVEGMVGVAMYKCRAWVSVYLTHTIFYIRRIRVLHSCAHWPRQAADGVLYIDLWPHSQRWTTFCKPFFSWIIDRILSGGSVWFHLLALDWWDLYGVLFIYFFKVLCFSIVSSHLLGCSKKKELW